MTTLYLLATIGRIIVDEDDAGVITISNALGHVSLGALVGNEGEKIRRLLDAGRERGPAKDPPGLVPVGKELLS
jgi:hypothetical protein